jgi:ATP-dependent DNA helicase
VQSLHAILKPFLLRRLKVDVETDLPPKKEYVLYAPLTEQQRVMYEAIAAHQLRQLLLSGKQAEDKSVVLTAAEAEAPRKTRGKKSKKTYIVDEDDDEYFENLQNGSEREDRQNSKSAVAEQYDQAAQIGKDWATKNARAYNSSDLLEPSD